MGNGNQGISYAYHVAKTLAGRVLIGTAVIALLIVGLVFLV